VALKAGCSRIWLWRGLVIAGLGLLLLSWLLPWWGALIPMVTTLKDSLIIHPYGLQVIMSEEDLAYMGITVKGMLPSWFTSAMWTYLGLCVGALVYSLFTGDKEVKISKLNIKWDSLLNGIVGFSFIVVAVMAAIIAMIKMGQYGMHFIGTTSYAIPGYEEEAEIGVVANVEASLRFGYWLAYGAGLFLIVLAFFRRRIANTVVRPLPKSGAI